MYNPRTYQSPKETQSQQNEKRTFAKLLRYTFKINKETSLEEKAN